MLPPIGGVPATSACNQTSDGFRNSILSSLPTDELDALRPSLTYVPLTPGLAIREAGDPLMDALFVESGLVSLIARCGEKHIQVGIADRHGLVGTAAILNADAVAGHRVVVIVPGHAYRISSVDLRSALERLPTLRERCLRHVEQVIMYTTQLVACNSLHPIQQRLARAMLVFSDALESDALPVTHNFLSLALGVRRAGITAAANRLEALGLVRLLRGKIIVEDHDGLASVSCNCYQVIRRAWLHDFAGGAERPH